MPHLISEWENIAFIVRLGKVKASLEKVLVENVFSIQLSSSAWDCSFR